jgi:hypothetical protein
VQHPKASPYLEYNIGQHNLPFQHVVAFEYLSTIQGARIHKITVASDHNESVIRDLQCSHKIVFRHGYAGGPLSSPITHWLTDYEIVFNALGINLTICGADRSLWINRGVRNRCFNNMPVSTQAVICK